MPEIDTNATRLPEGLDHVAMLRLTMLIQAATGHRSIRNTALELNMTPEEVQLVLWGELRQ